MQIFNISIIEVALLSALLSMFLDFTFRAKNIFDKWLDFWADRWLEKHKPIVLKFVEGKTDEDIVLATEGKDETVREYKHERVEWFWFKPLGGCVVCMNVWISFVLCVLAAEYVPIELPCFVIRIWAFEYIAGVILVVLLSNFIVRFFQEKIV